MRKKITIVGLFILMGISYTLLNSCKGKDGAPGAQGPQGNANVVSGLTTVTNWTYDGTNKLYTATIIDNNITQAIVDNGAVLVYLVGVSGGNLLLPATIYPAASYSETLTSWYNLQQVIIQVQDSDLTQPNNPGSLKFRIVKISGRIASHRNIDFENYELVKRAFNLKD